jgi:hypothetical protein
MLLGLDHEDLDVQDMMWTYKRPVTVDGVQISMADTRVFDVDKNLIRTWLLDRNLLVLDGAASLLNDLRPLLGRKGTHFDSERSKLEI